MKNVEQAEWQSLIDNNPKAVIIDVRTDGEYSSGHLENASNIDIFESEAFVRKMDQMDKTKSYFMYCRSGQRSANACRMIESLGFNDVYNLAGGIMSWTGKVI